MKMRNLTAALLAILTLSQISCGGGAAVETAAVTDAKAETETAAAETEDPYKPNLPETDFGGKEFRILTWNRDTDPLVVDFAADAETGDPVLDAVYLRNTKIEEQYNVDLVIDERSRGDFYGAAYNAIAAQDDLWELIDSSIDEMNKLTQSKGLYDLTGLEYLDLTQTWWDQNYIEDMSIGGRLYTILGDVNVFDDTQTIGLIYNKKIAQQFDIDNLYELVWDGTWTIDKLHEYVKLAAADVDGDGDMDEHDRWGMIAERAMLYFQMLGTGGRVAQNDADGYPYLTLNTERNSNALEKGHTLFREKNLVMLSEDWSHLGSNVVVDALIPMFKNDQSLFYFAMVGWGYAQLRDMESAFGILPVPKLDEAQDRYYNGVSQYWATTLGIPVTCPDPNTSAFVLEAMSAASVQTVTKTYNEVVFNSKGMRDEESVEIMDLIKNSRVYDVGYFNNWGSIQDQLKNILNDNPLQFASSYAKWEKIMTKAMEKTIALYEETVE